ncbi:MAG: HAD family hydrolase [Anaerolineales bacterium]|jgi:putative hydrolase of the HAD superfamily
MINVIGFDADDTLWHNESLYHQAKEDLSRLMSEYEEPQEVKAHLDQIEVENITYYGYGIKSFILSMIETASQVSAGRVTAKEINAIIDIAKRMLTAPVDLVEGVEKTLANLSSEYDLLLITKGDQFEQERKIRLSGIAGYFRYLEVVGEKSADSYRSVLSKYNLEPTSFLMVGNSLRSDILPVLKIGGRAVYIPNELTWFHEHAGHQEIGDLEYIELEHITQLPDAIATNFFRENL